MKCIKVVDQTMSPKLILCLALVLSGGLLACSTIARESHVASTDQYLWGEAVGVFQMATSLDETNGILHCLIRNAATNAVAYNDFYFGYSAHIRLEIRQGPEWARVGAEVFPGGNVVKGAVPTNTKVRWLQPGQIITNTWMRRDTFERRNFKKQLRVNPCSPESVKAIRLRWTWSLPGGGHTTFCDGGVWRRE
jgi:hypothetical protein